MSAPAQEAPLADIATDGAREIRLRHRLRLTAISLALAALTFLQEPGRIAADTKLDLAVDPVGFLIRSLTMWEPLGFFGQLQNQAYGYLFPVGPFFVLGDALGMPAWVVQRLWWSALLITAFLGATRLARLLGIRRASAGILAGLAYALAPRMITEIGVLSVEVLPFAVAPWVLVPLVMATQGRMGPRRAAALSGVAVLCAGGVNAVATAVLIPLGGFSVAHVVVSAGPSVLGGWGRWCSRHCGGRYPCCCWAGIRRRSSIGSNPHR
ncbi:MAG: alpha-(1-_3)-arabinofuranosyltransferase family protein [Candidatus Nanopelagicales bacterium]